MNKPAPRPVVTCQNQAGEEIERRGQQRDAIPVVAYPEGATVETIEGAAPGTDLSGDNFGQITNSLNDGRGFRFLVQFGF